MPVAFNPRANGCNDTLITPEFPWRIFASTAIAVLCITLLTVSFQSVKAAMTNPVNSLRRE